MKEVLELPVVEILQIGLPGLCFLLSFLGYLLLRAEQKKNNPRPSILKAIRSFNWTSLSVGILVAISSFAEAYFKVSNSTALQDIEGEFIVEQSIYEVDFRDWTPVDKQKIDIPTSRVSVTRSERILKNTEDNEDYVIPFYTTGAKIDYEPLQAPTPPTFKTVTTPGENPNRKDYQYELPIGNQVKGYKANLMTKFIFWNGFRDSEREWWAASIKYPTKQIQVTLHFPPSKPCKEMTISRKDGISAEVELRDKPAIISRDGLKVVWASADLPGNSRVFFKFQW